MDGPDDVFDADLGLDQIAISAEGFAAGALILATERGHHDYFDVFGFGSGSKNIKHIETADLWHHHVAHDELRTFFDSHRKRFLTVAGRYDIVSFGEEAYAIDFS